METTVSNGVYVASHLLLGGAKRRLCVFNGRVSVYTFNGAFVSKMCVEDACTHYGHPERWSKESKRNKLYNIAWMIDGHIREIISVNATYPVIKWKMKQLKQGGVYSCGLLMPVPSNLS